MQEALCTLSLEPQNEKGGVCSDEVLVGKILATRSFRRFTLTEIIQKTWRIKSRVQVEKIDKNIFKFCFGNREDSESIFKGRPWSMNGAHLILKIWPADRALKEISFDWSTFYFQTHVLHPKLIHEKIAKKVGKTMGLVHPKSLTKKCVVA